MTSVPPLKPWSVSQFEAYRPDLTRFVRDKVSHLIEEEDGPRHLLIKGHVKVGKREMVEYIAKRDDSKEPVRAHAFVSAFHRKADDDQRTELSQHNLHVFSLSTRSSTDPVIRWVESNIRLGLDVVIHFDEADYGSEDRQRLSDIWRRVKDNPRVLAIFYSATPEELRWSETITQDDDDDNFIAGIYEQGVMINYIPPPGYCGARRFLNEGLVTNARKFFNERSDGPFELTVQGRKIIDDAKNELEACLDRKAEARIALRKARAAGDEAEIARQIAIVSKPVRNIIALRLSYDSGSGEDAKQKVKRKAIYRFVEHISDFEELNDVNVIVDKAEFPDGAPPAPARVELTQIMWSKVAYWNSLTSDKIVIVIMDQTSSRSTEWVFHDRLFAEHEYRPNITFCAAAQAQLRVAHYESRYGGFQPIRVYGHLKTWKFADERISIEEFMNNEWKRKKVSGSDTYRIVNSNGRTHPQYPNPMSATAAAFVLEELGCDVDVKLSSRIRGKVRKCPEVLHDFEPCDPAGFQDAVLRLKNRIPGIQDATFSSPFKENKRAPDGRYMCPFRGEWDVREYPYFFRNRWGFSAEYMGPRIGVCYCDGVCGIAVRYTTGEFENIDTMETYRSMYVVEQ
jgi:hypothetical protein